MDMLGTQNFVLCSREVRVLLSCPLLGGLECPLSEVSLYKGSIYCTQSKRAVKRVNYRDSFGSNAGDSSLDQSDSSFKLLDLDDSSEAVQAEKPKHKKQRN